MVAQLAVIGRVPEGPADVSRPNAEPSPGNQQLDRPVDAGKFGLRGMEAQQVHER